MSAAALAFALRHWKALSLAAIAAGAIAWHTIEVRKAFRAGRAAERQAAAIAAAKRIQQMEQHNEIFRNLPPRDRCRVFMRDSGLPESHCD